MFHFAKISLFKSGKFIVGKINSNTAFSYSGSWALELDSGRWTLDAELSTLDAGRWTLDARLWTLYSEPGTLNPGHWTLSSGR